ncbi:MAG: YceD family protein [Povalibacter sp.]
MSRPQGAQSGASAGNSSSGGNRIDALVCARSGTTIERHFAAGELPRLQDAGAGAESAISARFHFLQYEGHVAIDGELEGVVVLTCQRCMKPLEFELSDSFKVLLVDDEEDLEGEPGGYEPVLANPASLDLQALAEDQALLALPLVPKHESETCIEVVLGPKPDESLEEQGTQRPFGNLRDLMRGREEK